MVSKSVLLGTAIGNEVSNRNRSRCATVLIAATFSAGTLLCSQASADDTEIYFASDLDTGDSTANVLFMFDTSGSMAEQDDAGISRLGRLKESMSSVVQSSKNVNIGIGSFSGGNRGSIQLPAIGVDADMCPNASCNSLKIRGEIKHNDDDAQGNANGNIDLNGLTLDLDQTASIWALRFDDLNIPRGATINSANLQFVSRAEFFDPATLTIVGEATDNSAPLTTTANNLSNRNAPGSATNAQVTWNAGNWWGWDLGENDNLSPNINTVVSEITDRPGWCGGNALTLLLTVQGDPRSTPTRDYDKYLAPVLQIDYDPSSVDWSDTCLRTKSISGINLGIDDVIEDAATGVMEADGDRLRTHVGTNTQTMGFRFTDVEIPANAQITTAYLNLPLDGSVEGDVDLTISVEDSSYSTTINSTVNGSLSGRTFMTNPVLWEDVPDSGSALRSEDISSLISAVVGKAGWANNGAITFTLTPTAGSTGQRFFTANDSPASDGATLVVHHQQDSASLGNTAPILATGRDEMIRTIMDYLSDGGTPMIDALYESGQYMRGGAVEFGDVPATGNYTAPEFGECTTNQIVLLSDGDANANDSKDLIRTLIEANPTASTTTVPTCAVRDNGSEECGIELAKWLAETDHDDNTAGLQPIKTHTIGFINSSSVLTSIAEAGDGSHYQASSASELASVFKNIIQSSITSDSSFIAPTSSINLSNRLINSNELYFALFKPSTMTDWNGNLKRFELGTNTTTGEVEIRDSLWALATNADGTIKSTAKSFWSDNADGGDVTKGGAASNLTLTRTLLTSMYDATLSKSVLKTFHENTTEIDLELLGIPTQNDAYRTELLQWARGVDIKDYDGDSNTTEVRAQMGDVMHSTQYILSYPGEESTAPDDTTEPEPRSTIFVGTNHGFLHAINTKDGTEDFAFIPEELLSNLDYFYRDQPTKHDQRPYGLDGEVSGWHNDSNGNGLVDNGEKAYIYVGMRRGGRDYYALDVSNPDDPKFAWKIEGGKGQFVELGQTWSRPIKANVNYLNTEKDVLFFAAGYDDANDIEDKRTADNVGRGIFMVDAATGAYITHVDTTDFTEMLYSIPSDLRIINPDGGKYSDAIFVGDTGGQVWRFDINNNAATENEFLSGHVIANVGGTLAIDNRKFFYEPDVALVKGEEGDMFLNVAIGSGSRPNPNSLIIEDSFYSFRDPYIFGPPRDEDGVIAYPTTLAESNLLNTSQALATNDDANTLSTGWFFRFPTTGEKSLSAALTVDNKLMFTTYAPAEPSDDICTATIGGGRVYSLDVFNGSPAYGSEVLTDRYAELQTPGIPPRVAGLIVEAAPNTVSILVGTETIGSGGSNKPFERTFWAEH
ncbi:MAG: PilC/PilY family type IV pilus protein [Granulosicoccus sp.]